MPLVALRPDLDGTLIAIIARAMEPNVERRFSSARAMMGALGAFLRGETPKTDPMSHAATALAAPTPTPRTGAPTPYGPPFASGPPPPMSPHVMHHYAHPTSGAGVVVAPYAVAPSARPPPSGSHLGVVFGGVLILVAGGAIAGAAWFVKTQHHEVRVAARASDTVPAPVDLAAAAQGSASEIPTLASTGSATPGRTGFPLATANATSLNAPPPPQPLGTANPALAGLSTAELMGQMVKAHTQGDGRTCMDAYDKLRTQPDFDPSNGYAMIHGDCVMAVGRCDEGRKIIRDYFSQPRPALQQMSASQIDMTVSNMAMTYCPVSQLTSGERLSRAQQLLYKAQGSKDTAGAARYADEMAAQIPQAPRGTEDERRKLVGYESGIGRAYGEIGRCADARRHFSAQCGLNSVSNVDLCAHNLLNSTSGCKGQP
jgi:hypothetical protein